MKEIKVYLQYPWKFPDSSYYKYLIDAPPKGVKYLNIGKKELITNKKKFLFASEMKRIIRRITYPMNIPLLNARKTNYKGKYDLIHCAHCLSLNDKPWVGDFEGYWQFWITGKDTKLIKKRVRKVLIDKNCKKILPWSNWAKQSILERFPEVKDKIEILHPAIPEIKLKKKLKKKNKIPTLIYVARYFWVKGGLVALESLNRLNQKYGVRAIVVSNVPENLKKKYKNLEIYDLVPREKLFGLMSKSDIFFYPSFSDTFGFSLLEAMSFGLPIIAMKTPRNVSVSEIIKEGKTGYLVKFDGKPEEHKIGSNEEKIIEDFVEKTSKLIENKKLIIKMSKNCLKEIKNGKFSVKQRNKKLKKIYQHALR
ncbi:glycosyltransferase family 4 protein [Nanoarchaeota archaeon]